MKSAYLFIFTATAILLPCTVFSKTISVPFTSQAPFMDWREPWQNACEESSIAMVDMYYRGKTFTPTIARQEILHSLKLKQSLFGWSLDEDAEKMVTVINNFYQWEASIVRQPTLDMIKKELDANRPIIALVHGKALKNPYFLSGGPDYHVLVLSGYDDDRAQFITQEPGTRRGLDFRYSYDTIMGALHDFVPGKRAIYGEPTVLFTSPFVRISGSTDGDRDGLSKADELRYGSIIWLKDSDGDGVSDGDEVAQGRSPTKR